ncbi:proteasome regulatory particle base subunit [Coemansia guatemalensis]|uniref:Ribophorin II n=1 Tax=Coemansia guatemalensis TaxID=2761395 RepID=A0A9W8HS92_9FUNG|nr:proteasome regulatory particle base subunit [Coemansia guatemalensis]
MRFGGHTRMLVVLGVLGSALSSLVSGTVVVSNIKVRVMERTGDKIFEQRVEQPNTLDSAPKVKASTPLVVTFDAQDQDGKALRLDQAMVSLQHVETKEEVALAARTVAEGSYKMDITRKDFRRHFAAASGQYHVALELGAFSSGGAEYEIGNIEMAGGSKARRPAPVTYGPKPEIHHRFADAQQMPNIVVSLAFTVLTAAPLVVLLRTWAGLGVNIDGLRQEMAGSVVFMGLIAAYMGLAIAYWVGLKLFPTLAYVLALAPPTYLAGQRALSKRIESKA